MKFRTRYMKVILAQHTSYGWKFTDAQLLADIQTRLRNWQVLATHNPKSLDDIVAAAAQIGDSNAPENVPSQQQILLLNDVPVDAKSSLFYVGGSGAGSVSASGSGSGPSFRTGRGISCFNCQGPHHVRDCPKPRTCHECGATDHFVKDCPKRSAKR